MSAIVLVHGMAATARSWADLPGRLKAAGHVVSNVTLPGHASLLEYLSADLDAYVTEVIEAIPSSDAAVLIGHSMGGFVISQTAAWYPKRVAGLIYVAAMMPSQDDTISGLSVSFGTGFKAIRDEFKNAGADLGALGLQPLGPLDDPFDDKNNMSSVPRHYIQCYSDTIIPFASQASMISAWPGTTMTTIKTGHLPQYTEPDELEKQIRLAL
ncbi:MAG: alpha/beta fold hydrolase [Pseudomonadota bacterium]